MVHLLQVYSNPDPGVVVPQDLLFRSSQSELDKPPLPSKRARQLRSDEIDRLLSHYEHLRNVRTVARDLGLSRTTVSRVLAQHEWSPA